VTPEAEFHQRDPISTAGAYAHLQDQRAALAAQSRCGATELLSGSDVSDIYGPMNLVRSIMIESNYGQDREAIGNDHRSPMFSMATANRVQQPGRGVASNAGGRYADRNDAL